MILGRVLDSHAAPLNSSLYPSNWQQLHREQASIRSPRQRLI